MVHLTEKPVELAARAIGYSSQRSENVLDLFAGSGSTLVACQQTGRRAYLMELDPLYVDVIVEALAAPDRRRGDAATECGVTGKMAKRRKGNEALRLALACGATVQSAAGKAGLSPRTAQRRLKDPEFRKQLDQLRGEFFERASGMLAAAVPEAIKALLSIVQDPSQPASVHVAAAKTMSDMLMKFQDRVVLTKRVSALEQQVDDPKEAG